jgi:endonuclease III
MKKGRFFARVFEVARLLERDYQPGRLGNKSNPLNELAYIILSSRTSEGKYQAVYRSFKRRFPRWEQVLQAAPQEIAASIAGGGLANQKAWHLIKIARRLQADFGRVSLRALQSMKTTPAEQYLCSLPGVGLKTARCVLLYSLGRPVFPADIHCLRIMGRLGWIDSRATSSRSVADFAQRGDELSRQIADAAQAGIPNDLREELHIRFVQHGRVVCRPRPDCQNCVLRRLCPRLGVGGQTLSNPTESACAGGGSPLHS